MLLRALCPPLTPPQGFGGWALGDEFRTHAMDEGGSRIRRRVCVPKRNRHSLGIIFAAPTAAELMPGDEEEEEEEMVAGSPRRKTVGVQPVEVQPHQLSSYLEFPFPFPTLGVMLQTQASYCAHPLKEWETKL